MQHNPGFSRQKPTLCVVNFVYEVLFIHSTFHCELSAIYIPVAVSFCRYSTVIQYWDGFSLLSFSVAVVYTQLSFKIGIYIYTPLIQCHSCIFLRSKITKSLCKVRDPKVISADTSIFLDDVSDLSLRVILITSFL